MNASRTRREVVSVLTAYGAVKLVIVAAAVAGLWLPFGSGLREDNYIYRQPNPARLRDRFSPFDGQWYLSIAETGYHETPRYVAQRDINFFPLYPAVIAAVAPLVGGTAPAGVLVSLIAGGIFSFLLYRLVREESTPAVASRTLWLQLIFPTAVVLSAVYSEALFLCLAVGALSAGRRQRWVLSASLGVLAAMTRSVGGLMVIPLLVQYARANGGTLRAWWRGMLTFSVIPLAVAGYVLFAGWISGDWLIYGRQVQGGWQQQLAFPLAAVRDLPTRQLFGYRNSLLDAVFGLLFAALLFPIARRLKPEYAAYALAFTLLPLSVTSTMSWTRYLLVSWPHFWYLAQAPWLKRPVVWMAVAATSLGGLVGYTLRFTTWTWIG